MRKSSRLFCVRDHFFLVFHPHSLEVCIPALLHSNTYLIFSQVSLNSLCVSGFYLQFFFSVPLLTFNWNILQHLPFMSCLLASLGLSSSFSPFTLAPLLAYFIYIFSSFSLNSCALPSHCLASSQIIAASLSFSHFFVKNLWVNPCLVLFGLLFWACFIPSGLFQVGSFPESFICFVKKKKRSFKKVSSISC